MNEPKNTTLITIVGRGRFGADEYTKSKYVFSDTDDGQNPVTTIFSKALIEHYGEQLDTIIFLGTETSTWSAVLPDDDEDLEEYRKHRRTLEKAEKPIGKKEFREFESHLKACYKDFNVVALMQKADLTLEDVNIYSEIVRNIKKDSKIIFDITSGFRYMPLFIYESLQTYSPKIDIDNISIVYAEGTKPNQPVPVRDISRVWRATEINKAWYSFERTFDAGNLVTYLRKEKGQEELADWLSDFSSNIQKSYLALCDMDFFLRLKEIIDNKDNYNSQPGYIKNMRRFLEKEVLAKFDFDMANNPYNKRSCFLVVFADLLNSKELFTQAIIALREALFLRIFENHDRKMIGGYLKEEELQKKGYYSTFNDKVKKYDYDLSKTLRDLKNIRNASAHAGMDLIKRSNKYKDMSQEYSVYRDAIRVVFEEIEPCKK